MNQIERFTEGLLRARRRMGERFSSKKGQKEIGDALEEIRELEERLEWTPKPKTPGIGTTGEGTKRMSRGELP